jgi:hypothetical protein
MGKIFNKKLSEKQLEELFTDDDECYRFLAEIKWENGFRCRKCGNTNYCEGKTAYSRRCTKCKTEESASSGTIFHNCKFPVHKAFYIAYNVCRGNEEISTYEYAKRLSLRQMTCWNFRKKIRHALQEMDSLSENERLTIRSINS